jgi:hypothetical protein
LSWCDKLASTPGVGFTFDAHLAPSASILSALAPVLEKWIEGDNAKLEFVVEKLGPFDLVIGSNSGFQYAATHSKFWIEFVHRMKFRAVTGGPPVAELTSEPLPFTRLLPEISARLIEATMLLPGITERKLKRIGIISTTALDDSAMPPGILRLIKYMGRPWQGKIENYSITIASELRETPDFKERCIHIITKSDDPEQLPIIKFDWQRWFTVGQETKPEILKQLLQDAEDSAVSYLEDLAEGNRFDEKLLGSTA